MPDAETSSWGVAMRRTSLLIRIACSASILAIAITVAPADASVGPAAGTISTFAGSPVFGPVSATSIGAGGGGSDDVATATIDGTTYAYYAGSSQNVVRRIDLTTGEEQVVAGDGGFGAPIEGSVATATTLGPADSIAVDEGGDIAILAEHGAVLFVPASSGSYFGMTNDRGLYLQAGEIGFDRRSGDRIEPSGESGLLL
jgi:hypothetical protein